MKPNSGRSGAILMLLSSLAAFPTQGEVIDANGHPATSPAHPGAILDTATRLLWLDATETVDRSVADVESELGDGGEFEGWQLATRDQLHELFVNFGLQITSPPTGTVEDADLQARVQEFVGIYGQTITDSFLLGTDLWHANSSTYGLASTTWIPADTRAWVGDNGTSLEIGSAHPEIGVALVRAVTFEIGNPLVNADDSSGNPGDIIFDATTAQVTITGVITSWSFFDDDDLDPNVVITPMILRHVGGNEYEITGIGLTRTTTETGAQTYPFDLQSGTDQVVADGTYYFGWRNANPDGSLHHAGGVDAAFTGNLSFFSNSSESATPVGSVVSFGSFQATYSYSATVIPSPEADGALLAAAALVTLAATRRSGRSAFGPRSLRAGLARR